MHRAETYTETKPIVLHTLQSVMASRVTNNNGNICETIQDKEVVTV